MESSLKQDVINSGSTMSNAAVLGEIVWLLSHSSLHQDWPIGSIQQWVFPALIHNQFRIYRRGGKPRGFVSWARMSKEIEEAYVLDTSSLRPDGWNAGDRIWIIDFVAPFGDTKEIARDMKTNVFPNDVGRYLRIKEGSDTMHIRYLHGINALSKSKDPSYNPAVELKEKDIT
ncbi:MAG: toxin-activating lysine-acyltransferase [Marinomonas sp.]